MVDTSLTAKLRFTTDDLRSFMKLPDWHRPDEAAIRDFLRWVDNTIEASPDERGNCRVNTLDDCDRGHFIAKGSLWGMPDIDDADCSQAPSSTP